MSTDLDDSGRAARLIPGAYERNTLTYREPGAMGADPLIAMPVGSSSMDAATIADREREGGGAPNQRRRKVPVHAEARTGPALRGSEPRGSWANRRFSMVSDTASRPPLSAVQALSLEEDASAERWRQWQVRNAVSSRKSAKQARIAFTVLFAGLGAWLGLQLLSPSLWP
jgi:hypothetical protein